MTSPSPSSEPTAQEFVDAVSDPLQRIGALHYFGPVAMAAAEELGLDGFRFYFAGRAGVLGDVSTNVMLSAFGYFNPSLVDKMWTTSKERCDVTAAAAAQLGVAYTMGDNHLADVDGLAEAAASLGELTGAVDCAGLGLFAGFRDQPIPDTPTHAFMHQAILYRELRGSVHLAALAATGCPSRVAHQIKRPSDLEMFGYKEEVEVTDDHRAAYAQAEPLTDSAMSCHVNRVLDGPQRAQIAAVVTAARAAFGD